MMHKKLALVTGITGQDGAYLSKLLLAENYTVVGLTRSLKSSNVTGLQYLNIESQIELIECDLLDISQIIHIISKYQPTEIYNLAAQSSVSLSFSQPIGTVHFNVLSVINILEAIRIKDKQIKFYQASSSEMFGNINNLPITEESVLHPQSPYAVSKAAAHWLCSTYRQSYGLYICCGILFNHESYLRNKNFFFKKVITDSIKISRGELDVLKVGNIDIKRDFGYAPKYVEAMHKMMQLDVPSDYLICSGTSVSLRDIISYIFERLQIPQHKLIIDQDLFRPAEIEDIYGSADNLKKGLEWDYSLDYKGLVDIILEEQMREGK